MTFLDYETRSHIVRLHEQGFPARAIAERFTLMPSEVKRFIQAGLPLGTPRPTDEQNEKIRALREQGLPLLAVSLRTGIAIGHVVAACAGDTRVLPGDPDVPQRAKILSRSGYDRIECCAILGLPKSRTWGLPSEY